MGIYIASDWYEILRHCDTNTDKKEMQRQETHTHTSKCTQSTRLPATLQRKHSCHLERCDEWLFSWAPSDLSCFSNQEASLSSAEVQSRGGNMAASGGFDVWSVSHFLPHRLAFFFFFYFTPFINIGPTNKWMSQSSFDEEERWKRTERRETEWVFQVQDGALMNDGV